MRTRANASSLPLLFFDDCVWSSASLRRVEATRVRRRPHLIHLRHRIVYRVDVDTVEILSVIQPGRRLPRLSLPPTDD
jgi:hypothetical protein